MKKAALLKVIKGNSLCATPIFLSIQRRLFDSQAKVLSVFLLLVFFGLTQLQAQTIPATSAEVSDVTTTSASFVDVTGASVTLDVTNVTKVMIVASINMKMTTAVTQNATYRIADNADNTINSGDIIRTANQFPGVGSQVYVFDVSAYSGNRTYYLQHKVAGNTLSTSASIVALALYDGTTAFSADVKTVSSPVSTSSATFSEVTGTETSTITTAQTGGFVVMASVQVAKTAGTDANGEWQLQYKKGSGSWTNLGYPIQRYTTGTGKGISSLVASLPSYSAADSYNFRLVHRLESGSGTPTIATEFCNLVAVSFANSAYMYQVLSGQKPTVSTSNNTFSDALSMPVTTNAGVTPKILMLGQFNMEANNSSNAPSFDFAIDNGATYNGLDHQRYISSNNDVGSAVITSLSPILSASTSYAIAFRHASNSSNPIRQLTSFNINCVGVALEHNAFVVYPVLVNSSLGLSFGNYNTLKEAFDKVNDGTHKGSITITVNASTTETASAVLYNSGYSSSSYTDVLIIPTASGLKISGTIDAPLIDLNNADNVTIDGRLAQSGVADLTLENLSTHADAATVRLINSAQNNTVKYCTIKGAPNSYNTGVVFISTSTSGSGTGNDNNTIFYNNITNNGSTTTMYNAVQIAGSNPRQTNNITVSNNNIYDFINSTAGSNGIHVASFADNITITGNSLYLTAPVNPTVTNQYYAPIHTENTAMTELTVSNNYIGGSAPLCAGSAFTMSSSDDFQLEVIDLHLNASSSVLVDGNTIKNISITSSHEQPFLGIDIVQGSATITNNIIGAATGNGAISITNTYNNSLSNGIWLEDIVNVTVQNNTVGSVTTVGSLSYGCSFVAINNDIDTDPGTVIISDNLIGSLTTANSIQASFASTDVEGQKIMGIRSAAIGTTTIQDNTVSNLYNAYAGTSNKSRTVAIITESGTNTITKNTINTVVSASAQGGIVDSASVCGIVQLSKQTSSTQEVSFNTVSSVQNTHATADVNAVGICFSATTTGTQVVKGNMVRDVSLASSNTDAMMVGISMKDGIGECSNNIVVLGAGVTNGNMIVGINDQANTGDNHSVYFNTVYIEGVVSSGATASTYGLRRVNNSATSNYRANILYNNRSGGTTGVHYAVYLVGSSGLTIDYNDYYAPNGALGYLGGDVIGLVNWQAATSQDANSVNSDPSFDNAGGNLPIDYYIGAALWITNPTTIIVDYGQITRGAPTLMGALERHDYYWQGDVSTDFATAANWSVNAVPLTGANIIFIDNPDFSCYLDADRVVGNIDINQNTDILVLNGHKLTIVGDILESTSNQIDADGAGDILEFAGGAAQSFPSDVFVNDAFDGLEVDNLYGLSLPQNITVGDLTLTRGVLTIGANTLTVIDAITQTSGSLLGGASSSIVIGDAGAAPTTNLPAVELLDLTVNRAAGIGLGGQVSVSGALSLSAGTLSVGANILYFNGTSVARTSGAIDASNAAATLEFYNPTSIILPASVFNAAVNNLTISGGGIVASDDISLNGLLNLESDNPSSDVGLLDMGTDTLHLAAASTSMGLGDVEGYIKRTNLAFDVYYSFGNPYNTIFMPTQAYTLPTAIYAKLELTGPTWDAEAILRTMDLVRIGGDPALTFNGSVHYRNGELNGNRETRLSIWSYDTGTATASELGRTEVNVFQKWVGIGVAPLALLSTDFDDDQFSLKETAVALVTWDGSESSDWLDPFNWDTDAVPANTDDVLIPDAVTTPNDPTLPNTTTIKSLILEDGAILHGGTGTTLTLEGEAGAFINEGGEINPGTSTLVFTGANATWSGNLDVYNLTIETGASIVPVTGAYMTISGAVTNNGTWKSTITPNTVEYAGSAQTVLNTNGLQTGYYNLVLSGSGTKTMPATALNVQANFTLKGSASASLLNDLDVNGDVSLEETAALVTGTHTVTFGGDVHIHNSASLSSNATGSISMDGSAKELLIDPLARFDNAGAFTASVNGYISFLSDNTSTAQLLNTGTVTNASAVVRLQKQLMAATGWYFMTMPFDVPNSSITDAGTGTPVTWTGLTGVADIYVQAYDGFNRDAEGLPNVSGSGVYWIDVPSKQMDQYKGYIVASDYDRTINFSSTAGESDLFASTASVPVSKYITNTNSQHHSWNLLGNPFSSGFDLYDATQEHAPFYYYDGSNYVTVMAGDHYTPYPFMAFFLQAFGVSNNLVFASTGLEFRSASAMQLVDFDEIDLSIVQNDTLTDRLRIRLRTDATANFDPSIDAFKFRSLNLAYPQLYARSNNYNYSVHALAPLATSQTIPISYIAGSAGNYKVVLNSKAMLKRYSKVTLRDASLSVQQDLVADSVYAFTSAKGTFSSRFSILLEAPVTDSKMVVASADAIVLKQEGVGVRFDGLNSLATVVLYDMAGNSVAKFEAVDNNQFLPISLYGGYLINVQTSTQSQAFKVLLIK